MHGMTKSESQIFHGHACSTSPSFDYIKSEHNTTIRNQHIQSRAWKNQCAPGNRAFFDGFELKFGYLAAKELYQLTPGKF